MTEVDVHTLTGAYAVNALPDDERQRFERHLRECRACQLEVRELQATAARLGGAEHEEPPASLKASVLAEVDRTRQEPPPVRTERTAAGPTRPAPRARYQRLLATAAAVLAIVVIALSVVVVDLRSRLDDVETLAVPVTDVLRAPDAVSVSAEGPGRANVRFIASPTRGEGVLLVGAMDRAPEGRVYQLWLLRDGDAAPAGLLDVDERGRGAHVVTGDLTTVDAVALTVEPDGGSPQPTSDPVVVLPFGDA